MNPARQTLDPGPDYPAPSLRREIKPTIIPQPLRNAVRGKWKSGIKSAFCVTTDVVDHLRGARGPLIPPSRLRVRVGCFASYLRISRYRAVGEEAVEYVRELAGMVPTSRVLDIGCGCGQFAGALATRGDFKGKYEGFDPDREAIKWCASHISPRYPNFRFTSADLSNSQYNPNGSVEAAEYRFPYAGESFDVILLKSVFTHLQSPVLHNYLSEISRLLASGGKALASFFLLNSESNACIQRGESDMVFRFKGRDCHILEAAVPEYLLSYDEGYVRDIAASLGLCIDKIAYGSWCGRRQFRSYQDLVVLVQMVRAE